jgi:tetratricopeptide (TPR) repeat protein
MQYSSINEGDTDWRTRYFLANDYQNIGNLDKAIVWRSESYVACIDGPVVKSYIARNIADNYLMQEDSESALEWLHLSLEQSRERETLYSLARLYSALGNHESAYNAASDCLNITERRDGFTFSPEAWEAGPHDILAISAYYLGEKDLALAEGKKALELDPENKRLLANLKWYEKANDK